MRNHTNIIGNIPLLAAIAFIVSVGFAPGSIRAQEAPEAIRKLAFLEGIGCTPSMMRQRPVSPGRRVPFSHEAIL